jgi:hypothetical protein
MMKKDVDLVIKRVSVSKESYTILVENRGKLALGLPWARIDFGLDIAVDLKPPEDHFVSPGELKVLSYSIFPDYWTATIREKIIMDDTYDSASLFSDVIDGLEIDCAFEVIDTRDYTNFIRFDETVVDEFTGKRECNPFFVDFATANDEVILVRKSLGLE